MTTTGATRAPLPAPTHGTHSRNADGAYTQRVADILRSRAAATPDAVAVIEPDRTTTFAELDRRSSQVARALLADGVGRDDRVAYIGANAPSFLEVFYGAAKLGAVATALNNRLSPAEVAAILADATPSALVVGAGDGRLIPPAGTVGSLRRVVTIDGDPGTTAYQDWLGAQPADDPGVTVDPDDTAVVFFTSGTTGRPKGIMLTGDNLGRALLVMHEDMDLGVGSVATAPIPFFHIAGFGLSLVSVLNGSALLLETVADPRALIRQLVERRVTHAAMVPTVIQTIVNLPEARSADWSNLRYIVYGASPIPVPVLRAATELLGCRFLQSYGLTESTGGATLLGPDDHVPDAAHERRLQSVGRPMAGADIRIVDPVTLEDLPPGHRGEVLIGGGRVMRGYLNRPDETARAILDGGWLRTGDGGSFDEDGYLYLHDRLKDMIISGGENVYPAEVESVLTGHPAIAEVAVVGIPSERWGESAYAVAVLRPGATCTESDLLEWARGRLAHFKCPVGVSFVDALPRNASGKLLKTRLRDEYAAGAS